jgi:hypothetical protein
MKKVEKVEKILREYFVGNFFEKMNYFRFNYSKPADYFE